MVSIALSVFACVGWGVADFIGGFKSRNLSTLSILLTSYITGTLVLGFILSWMRSPLPDSPGLLWAALAGPIGLLAMYLLYRSMAVGTMSVLAPISATGVMLPVVWGLLHGDSLSRVSMLGIFFAIVGSLLAVMENGFHRNQWKMARGTGLAVGSAFFVGLYFITMDAACDQNPIWASMLTRVSTLLVLIPILYFAKAPAAITKHQLPFIILMGMMDTMAAFCFALATSKGMLSEVAVISSLYPAVTVILSSTIVKESMHRVQYAGIALALCGVALISAF